MLMSENNRLRSSALGLSHAKSLTFNPGLIASLYFFVEFHGELP